MTLRAKPLDAITESDLQTLVENEVQEDKLIEYKESLPGNSYDEKKEFLADVSSFANASGGDLIYGIKEDSGIAKEASGLDIPNVDAEKLRLDSMIRSGVEPRIYGIDIQPVTLASSRVVLIVRVPKSWNAPHVAKFQKHWRFYSRNSAGKYPLDVGELRTAFALSEQIGERIRNFRSQRLAAIVAGETPIALNDAPKVVIHIVPFSSFDSASVLDVSSINEFPAFQRMFPYQFRYNIDGLVGYLRDIASSGTVYWQFFRNGTIEYVNVHLLTTPDDQLIPSRFHRELAEMLKKSCLIQQYIGVEFPVVVMLSLLGVSGYKIKRGSLIGRDQEIDRDNLMIPEIIIDNFEFDPFQVMRPIFDAVWNAAGWPRAMTYDDEGKWIDDDKW